LSEAARYLLDTNVVSDLMSGRSRTVRARFEAIDPQAPAGISVITHAEILFGLEKKPEASRIRASFEDLSELVQILPWGLPEARAYARLRAWLRLAGKSLSMMDMLIAAQAIASDAILVTRDGAFQHAVPLLQTENWEADA
jgi:tRNA(fMet)-specific endonuclease VapC